MKYKKICDNKLPSCPCRVIDLDNNTIYCNFIFKFGTFLIDKHDDKVKHFLQKICPEQRNSVLEHDFRAEILQNFAKNFLSEAKIGDKVYCTAEPHSVLLIEKPDTIYGDCKYQTIDNKLKKAPAFCFNVISDGNYYSECEFKNKNNADHFKYLARRNGYRAEIIMIENSYLLKIYGDTQEEVDDFVTFCGKSDFIIDV